MAEIIQEAELITGGFEVVGDLSPMLIRELGDSLQLDNNFAIANKIRLVLLFQNTSAISQHEGLLRNERDTPFRKLDGQTFLIDWLQETAAQCPINFHASPIDRIALFFIE